MNKIHKENERGLLFYSPLTYHRDSAILEYVIYMAHVKLTSHAVRRCFALGVNVVNSCKKRWLINLRPLKAEFYHFEGF